MADWMITEKELPPNGEVVDAMDSEDNVQRLKRKGNLWWLPDESMFVYFVPKFWKAIHDH